MWDGLFTLVAFTFVMGISSFLAGSIPYSFGLSQNHSRVISAIGTGLLIGTCLIIIIPEGIETLYAAAHYSSLEHSIPVGDNDDAHDDSHSEPHAWVGLSLIVGFIMMYLIDKIPRHTASHSSRKQSRYISLANLGLGPHRSTSPGWTEGNGNSEEDSVSSAKGSATTTGLVIHAAADGIALAASTFISESSTGIIVFLAIMIHKAPAAFGLTSVLLKQGLTKRQTRIHLIVFSLAAPVGALVTWILVNLLAGGELDGEGTTRFATGLLLLFSGGTFLYVAMHTMQEEGPDAQDNLTNGHAYSATVASKGESDKSDWQDTLLSVVGMLIPLLAQLGHAH